MNLAFKLGIADAYKSNSQKARVITESWLSDNMYCPICGHATISHFTANKPVADFFCPICKSEYELKSSERKTAAIQRIIPDGAYHTMIERINSYNNPNLFILTHFSHCVKNLFFIPKFFFVPDIIIKRPPLKESACRAGWEGCNINIGMIPNHAKIPIILNGEVIPKNVVLSKFNHLKAVETNSLSARGWIMDTMKCIDKISKVIFSLEDIYMFEPELSIKYPDNHFIKEKLRQQLQILRDKGLIEFISRGHYKKVLL